MKARIGKIPCKFPASRELRGRVSASPSAKKTNQEMKIISPMPSKD